MIKFDFLKKRTFWRYTWAIILILWLAFIFSNSLSTGDDSKKNSDRVVDVIENTFQKISPNFSISAKFVRKLAHFIEFSVLGALILSYRFLWDTDSRLHVYRTLFFGMLTALIDETLQLSSPGRGSRVSDVWIDFSAILVSIIVYFLILFIIKHIKVVKHHDKSCD